MNQLSVQQRKLVYLVGMVLMSIVVVYLGIPAGRDLNDTGGKLAQLRQEHGLGEASFGNVDPTSSTMTLMLLGFRGIAADILWVQADKQKEHKDWSGLESTTESIVLLQPTFPAVWQFQSWNLGFNVSAECDDTRDRYFWVKAGAAFLNRGIDRNQRIPEMYHDMGNFVGRKIGYSDERDVFRQYFRNDPDEKFDRDQEPDENRLDNGPDPAINPGRFPGKAQKETDPFGDNYLAARLWFQESVRVLKEDPNQNQTKMARELFLTYPPKALMDYARARQRDGVFDENVSNAWRDAYVEWTQSYGNEELDTPKGPITLNGLDDPAQDAAELERIARRDNLLGTWGEVTVNDKRIWRERRRDMTNYRYWKQTCRIEQDPDMVKAKGLINQGYNVYRDGNLLQGGELLLQGMALLESILKRPENETLVLNDSANDYIEDAIEAVIHLRNSRPGQQLPETYPLQAIYENPKYSSIREDREEAVKRGTFNY